MVVENDTIMNCMDFMHTYLMYQDKNWLFGSLMP